MDVATEISGAEVGLKMKGMFQIKFCFLILVSFACNALALNMTPDGIYEATHEACSSVSESDIEKSIFALQSFGSALQQDRLLRGHFPSTSFNEIVRAIQLDSAKAVLTKMDVTTVSPFARNILASSSFEQALDDCYQKSTAAKEFFRKSILRADTRGKALGALTVVTAVIGSEGASAGFGTLIKRWSTASSGGFGALAKGWSTVLYRSLVLAQKTYSGLMAASLLRGDSEIPEPQPMVLNLSIDSQFDGEARPMTPEECQKSSVFLLNLSRMQLQTLNQKLTKVSDPKARASLTKAIEQEKKLIRDIENSMACNANQ